MADLLVVATAAARLCIAFGTNDHSVYSSIVFKRGSAETEGGTGTAMQQEKVANIEARLFFGYGHYETSLAG